MWNPCSLFSICVLCIFPMLNQDKPTTWIDGYEWEDMPKEAKLYYVWGFRDGQMSSTGKYSSLLREHRLVSDENIRHIVLEELRKEFYFAGGTFGQMIDGVDELYKDYANKKIPVHSLVRLVCLRTSGELKTEEIEKELQRLRAKISKIGE